MFDELLNPYMNKEMESRGCHRSFPRVCKHAQPICSTQLNIVGQEMNSWFGPGGTGKGYLVQSPDSRQHFSKYGKSCKVLQKSSELGHDSASVGDWHCIVVYQRRNNSTVKKKTKKKTSSNFTLWVFTFTLLFLKQRCHGALSLQ